MSDRYISVPLTRDQGIARMFAAAAAVKGTLADVDMDGDVDVDDVDIDVLLQPVRELQRIPCYYELGAGGRNADKLYPWDDSLQCDCSAAVGHWIGKPRGNGDWGTTKILSDAYKMEYAPGTDPKPMINVGPGPQTRWRGLAKDELVEVGDILIIAGVYGLRTVDGKLRRYRKSPGHIEMVSGFKPGFVRANFAAGDWKKVSVIGCSPYKSQMFGTGHAIAETNASFGRTRGYFLRFKGWVQA